MRGFGARFSRRATTRPAGYVDRITGVLFALDVPPMIDE
jgi:hypothetical protein